MCKFCEDIAMNDDEYMKKKIHWWRFYLQR